MTSHSSQDAGVPWPNQLDIPKVRTDLPFLLRLTGWNLTTHHSAINTQPALFLRGVLDPVPVVLSPGPGRLAALPPQEEEGDGSAEKCRKRDADAEAHA